MRIFYGTVIVFVMSFIGITNLSADSLLQTFVEDFPAVPIDEKLFLHVFGDSFGEDTGLEGNFTFNTAEYHLALSMQKKSVLQKAIGRADSTKRKQFQDEIDRFDKLINKLSVATELSKQNRHFEGFQAAVSAKIAALAPGEDLLILGGWYQHAVLYQVIKQVNGQYTFQGF